MTNILFLSANTSLSVICLHLCLYLHVACLQIYFLAELRNDYKDLSEKINENLLVLHSARRPQNVALPVKDTGKLNANYIQKRCPLFFSFFFLFLDAVLLVTVYGDVMLSLSICH